VKGIRDAIRAPRPEELMWALRDVSFELRSGQVLGIVGRNGAGKSTLLKILARITDPTEGYAEVEGRVSSLLEVGTGFHPELTGRDNVFLNGAILGMRRSEVAAKFDSIVEFSGIERFIDTPVKRYSSGMYARLAFAVAAHLEPDILLVDEVLAVGDAEFQKRSLGKMRDATGEGRTVIFVSHNMASIRMLCHSAILLDYGRVRADGDVDTVITEYLSTHAKAAPSGVIAREAPRIGSGEATFTRVALLDRDGRPRTELYLGQPLTVDVELQAARPIPAAMLELGISGLDGTRVTTSFSTDGEQPPFRLAEGRSQLSVELEPFLLPGHYTLDLGLHHAAPGWTVDFVERILDFEVLNVAEEGGDRYPTRAVRGYVRPPARWYEGGESALARPGNAGESALR
jgi:lipopolysaccharide transport system ATP-binding protein